MSSEAQVITLSRKVCAYMGSLLMASVLLTACSQDDGKNKETAERHQNSAKIYQQQGQLRAAILEARNAIQLEPESASSYVSLAKIFNSTGAYSSSINMLEPLVGKLPEVAGELSEAYMGVKKFRTALQIIDAHPAASSNISLRSQQLQQVALANIALGDKAAYEDALDTLRSISGNETEVQYLEANFLLSQGQTEEALSKLNTLLEQDDKHYEALFLKGNLLTYQKKLSDAEQSFTAALALLPNTDIITIDRAQVLSQLTDVLIRQGRTSEAYTYQKLLADANPERNEAQQKFTDAMEYYQQGKLKEAEKLLKELRIKYPDDKNTATLLGMIEFQQGADQSAIDLFDQFIDTETATPTVIQAAALAKFRSNQVDDAIKLLEEAAENQPNNPAILATYGLALLDRDATSSDGAIAVEKSLALEPRQQRLRIALAKRYNALEQPEQAIAQMQKAFDEQPMDLLVQQTYLKLLLNNGDDARIKQVVNDLAQRYPQSPRPPFLLGWYEMTQKNYKQAESLFEKALSVKDNEEKALAYAGLAQTYQEQGLPQKALVTWQAILELEPRNLNAYRPWLTQMVKLKRTNDAISFLKKLQKNSQHWQPSAVLAQLLAANKQTGAAIEYIESAVEKSGGSEHVQSLAANLYAAYGAELRKAGKIEESREYILKAVALFPNQLNYVAGLIETEIAASNLQEAQKLLAQYEVTPDTQAGINYLQALIYTAEGKVEEAHAEYQKSWDLKPTELAAEAIYKHISANDKEHAKQFVIQWQERMPRSYRPTLILAMDAQEAKDNTSAIKWYEKALDKVPQSPAILNNLAWNYYLVKDPKALELAKKAYDLAPNSAPVLDTYGWILVEHGKIKEGIHYLERAVEQSKGNQEIEGHLEEARSRLKAR